MLVVQHCDRVGCSSGDRNDCSHRLETLDNFRLNLNLPENTTAALPARCAHWCVFVCVKHTHRGQRASVWQKHYFFKSINTFPHTHTQQLLNCHVTLSSLKLNFCAHTPHMRTRTHLTPRLPALLIKRLMFQTSGSLKALHVLLSSCVRASVYLCVRPARPSSPAESW